MEPEEPKKSETIEVRVPWRLKQDFMARARREGRSASEVIRDLMADYVRRPAQRTPQQTLETAMTAIRKRPRAGLAAILGAAGISAVLASTIPAGAAIDLRAQFERLDTNGDGIITMEEMAPGGVVEFQLQDSDGPAGAKETPPGGVVEFRTQAPDGSPGADFDIIGPILLPVTDASGEKQVMMVQMARHRGEAMELVSPAPLMGEFQAGDANTDGTLSFAEFEARYIAVRSNSFDTLDADGDGVISEAEITANPLDGPGGEQTARALRGIDANGDRRLTREEYNEAL